MGGDSKSQYFTHPGLTEFDRLQRERLVEMAIDDGRTHFVSSAVKRTETEPEGFFLVVNV